MNVYEIVAERIINELQSGKAPWRKSWSSGWSPKNFVSGKAYRGINYALLSPEVGRRECPNFGTKNQIFQRGGRIKSDEWKNYSIVTFWKLLDIAESDDDTGDDSASGRIVPLLRYYKVWNLAQTEGIPWSVPEEKVIDPIEACEAIVRGYEDGPAIVGDGGDQAFYRPSTDTVSMPPRNSFLNSQAYYETLFHELCHSTKNGPKVKNRLDRNGSRAAEELVAEFGSSMLLGHAEIMERALIENSAAYIRSWIQALRNDPKCIVIACSRAQKAADWILGKREAQREELRETVKIAA